MTIASGGCNVLNYLTYAPTSVVAVDLNAAHMALTRLKLAALQHLPDYAAFYEFFGRGDLDVNLDRYRMYLRHHLDPDTRRYWETPTLPLGRPRIRIFASGLYERGRLSVFVRFVHNVARQMGYRPKALLAAQSMAEQEQFVDEVVAPFFRSRLVQWVAGRPMTVFSLGIPPQQHKAMAEDETTHNLIELYLARLRKLVCGFPLYDNYFAWQVLGQQYDHASRRPIPEYLRAKHCDTLRDRLHRVTTHRTSYHPLLSTQPDAAHDGFVLHRCDGLDASDDHHVALARYRTGWAARRTRDLPRGWDGIAHRACAAGGAARPVSVPPVAVGGASCARPIGYLRHVSRLRVDGMSDTASSPAAAVNWMYRYTRHVYDASRRYDLLGRDELIDRMAEQEPGAVLEVGCGTARNLIRLHQRAPSLDLYGLDAADVMLDTARRSIARAGRRQRVRLAQGLAQRLDPQTAFGRHEPFDAIFFSYALSMMPAWPGAVEMALQHLKPVGRLDIIRWTPASHEREALTESLQSRGDGYAQGVSVDVQPAI